jgi:hypothetical protein
MPPCLHRENLTVEYHEAVQAFSYAVKRLRESDRTGVGFEEHHRATELARQRADNARTMLDLHRTEHGC